MKITKDGFCFDFERGTVIDFDKSHNARMKKVDLIVEFEDGSNSYDLYVEIKDLTKIRLPKKGAEYDLECRKKYYGFLERLKYQYRDTYLYRYAQGKVKKKIFYICLLSLSPKSGSLLCYKFGKDLCDELPLEPKCEWKWEKMIADACVVVDERLWKKNWPKWKLERLPEARAKARPSEKLT